MAGFATLLGGGLAGLAGANVQGGATAAQNEVLNNDTASQSHIANALTNGGFGVVVLSIASMVMPWLPGTPMARITGQLATSAIDGVKSTARGVLSMAQANYGKQTPPSDANPVVQADDGNDTPSGTAGAVVTPSVPVPVPNGTIATTPPVIVPGTPILSSGGSGDDTGSSQSSAASNGSATSSMYDTSITSPGSKYPNVRTDVTASQFQANLIANGYSVQNQGTSTNGAFTVLSNGTSTYTIYTRTSTGAAGVQYIAPNGAVKFSLGGH